MAYYSKVLRPEEKVLFLGELHPIIYLRPALAVIAAILVGLSRLALPADANGAAALPILTLGLLALGGVGLLAAWIRRVTTEIVVTSLRVIVKRGLISRRTVEMNMSKIETVDVSQNILARLLGFGTVLIRGTGAGLEPLPRVSNPVGLRNAILVG